MALIGKYSKLAALFLTGTLLSSGLSAGAVPTGTVVVALGTSGGPQPNLYRSQPAHALEVNGETYLIDAGNGVARQLVLAGIPADKPRKIFITHNHDDHNADLGALMGISWSLRNKDDYDIFGPDGTQKVVDGFLQYYSVNSAIRAEDSPLPSLGRFEGDVHVHPIGGAVAAKTIYRDENVTVSAIENCHYHHDDPVSSGVGVERSYAFRFETRDRVVVFSGDTGPCPQLVDFAKGADVLVHEIFNMELMADNFRSVSSIPGIFIDVVLKKSAQYHTVPEEVGKLANAAKVGMVVLTHVMPGRKADPDDAYTRGVSANYSGRVIVARDLGRY